MKKRSAKGATGAEPNLVDMNTKIFQAHSALVEHMSCRRYEDGDERDPGWITIATSGASWTVTIKDPDSACSFRVLATSLDQALDTACLLLACDEAPWEHDRFLATNQKKKKK